MKRMIYILIGMLLLSSANSAQSAVPRKSPKVSSDKINTLKTRCNKDSYNACYELGNK